MPQQGAKAPLSTQAAFWDRWNAEQRENQLDSVSLEQADVVASWLDELGSKDLDIIEVGCGAGWLCGRLAHYGHVTATDLSHEVLERASQRHPTVNFVAGDFMALAFDRAAFDVVVSLEVLSHVADQPAFITKLASLLRSGGYLMLATQNRPQLERNVILPPRPGQLRRWVDRHELASLLDPEFEVERMFSITPRCNRGVLRIVNSGKLNGLLSSIGLGAVSRWAKSKQERAWLGWTIMCLAKKR